MIARIIGFALLLVASAALAEDKNITISSNGVAVATLSVPEAAKVTSSAEKTAVDTKDLTLYLWVVPKAKTVGKVIPKVAEVIKGEVKDFVVQRTNTITVAGAEAKHLIGSGKEADDGDPASADVVVFTVGKTGVGGLRAWRRRDRPATAAGHVGNTEDGESPVRSRYAGLPRTPSYVSWAPAGGLGRQGWLLWPARSSRASAAFLRAVEGCRGW